MEIVFLHAWMSQNSKCVLSTLVGADRTSLFILHCFSPFLTSRTTRDRHLSFTWCTYRNWPTAGLHTENEGVWPILSVRDIWVYVNIIIFLPISLLSHINLHHQGPTLHWCVSFVVYLWPRPQAVLQPVCFSFCLTSSLKCSCMWCVSVWAISWVLNRPLPAWLIGCLCSPLLSQKGGELGLSILDCELHQWLGKAASGLQPISSLPSVLHSYGCLIGPGVAGWAMDKWQKRQDCESARMSPFTEREGSLTPSACAEQRQWNKKRTDFSSLFFFPYEKTQIGSGRNAGPPYTTMSCWTKTPFILCVPFMVNSVLAEHHLHICVDKVQCLLMSPRGSYF